MPVYLKKKAQIGALLFHKAFIEVSIKYSYFNNIFSAENAIEFLEYTRIYSDIILLEKEK